VDSLGLDSSVIENPHLRVSEFIPISNNYNISKLRSLISQEDVILIILGIPLSHFMLEESFCGGIRGWGQFSTKTATSAAYSNIEHQEPKWSFN